MEGVKFRFIAIILVAMTTSLLTAIIMYHLTW
jgi:hypothetical protein